MILYEVYEGPKKPTEEGKYIGRTPILSQAEIALKHLKEKDKDGFIKVRYEDGSFKYLR